MEERIQLEYMFVKYLKLELFDKEMGKEREFGTADTPAAPGRSEMSQVLHRARRTAMK